jgi:AcrR family transcriptional regulator
MPRLIDTDHRTEDLVFGVDRLLTRSGILGLTMRAIAAETGISTGSLLHHFESRQRILAVAANRTGRQLLYRIESDAPWIGVQALLPDDQEGRLFTRAWLAWCELWRSEPWLKQAVGDIRARELDLLARLHEHRLSRPDLDTFAALVDGLRGAVCAPQQPMPIAGARELLSVASATALERSA